MTVSDGIKLGIAIAALVVSVVAYVANRQTAQANERMAQANERMAEANDEANAISRDLLDANRHLLAANDRMAKSAEVSAQAAREAADSAVTAYQESKMAVIELVTRGTNVVGSRKSDEVGSFILWLRNEGQATAYDLAVLGVLTVDRQGIQPATLGPARVANIEPGEEKDCELPVSKVQFGDVDSREVEFRVSFADGLGKQERRFRVGVYNYWQMNWSSQRLE